MPAMLLDTSPQQATRSSNLQPGLLPNHWYGDWGQVNHGYGSIQDQLIISFIFEESLISPKKSARNQGQRMGKYRKWVIPEHSGEYCGKRKTLPIESEDRSKILTSSNPRVNVKK